MIIQDDEKETIFHKIYKDYKIKYPLEFYFENTNKEKEDFKESKKEIEDNILSNKKGRKKKINSRKIHSRSDCDNIKSKIKTHFHLFIISFLNKKLKENNIKFHFKKIDTKITKNITITYNKKLLGMQIKEIIKNVSDRYYDKSSNKKLIQKIENSNNIINNYLNMTYMEMFNNLYLNSKSEMFKNEKNDTSYEAHLEKIKSLYGIDYFQKFNFMANNFVDNILNYDKKKKEVKLIFLNLEKKE